MDDGHGSLVTLRRPVLGLLKVLLGGLFGGPIGDEFGTGKLQIRIGGDWRGRDLPWLLGTAGSDQRQRT